MTKFQFRTNWRGKLILQCLHTYRDNWGDPYTQWHDATTQDLKSYYAELYQVQAPLTTQELRRRFDAESG